MCASLERATSEDSRWQVQILLVGQSGPICLCRFQHLASAEDHLIFARGVPAWPNSARWSEHLGYDDLARVEPWHR